jgi:tRNA dimethylallyltransferase
MGSVGYRQVRDALATGGAIDHAELTEAIRRATRVFARRQRTWLRREPVEWLDPENALETLLSSLEV